MATSPAARAVEVMTKCAAGLKAADSKALNAAGLEAKNVILAELAKVASSGRLRGAGRSGAKLGVGYKVTGDSVLMTARGPWQLIERGTRAHAIRPRKNRGKRAVSFGGRAYARVRHPGTRGKHPWEKGRKAAEPKVIKILDQRYRKAVTDAF